MNGCYICFGSGLRENELNRHDDGIFQRRKNKMLVDTYESGEHVMVAVIVHLQLKNLK